MTYIEKTYRFLSEKPSLKVFSSGGEVIEFSPYYETKDENIANELRKLSHVYEIDSAMNSVDVIPSNIVQRDSFGRAKVATPLSNDDIVNVEHLEDRLETKAEAIHTHTKYEVSLENVDNTSDINKPLSMPQKMYVDEQVGAVVSEGVPDATDSVKGKARFAMQSEVDEITSDNEVSELISDANITPATIATLIRNIIENAESNNTTITETLQQHLTSINPHNVSTVQLGIENVDNTSDIDKPVSTATNARLESLYDELQNAIASLAPKPTYNSTVGQLRGAELIDTVHGTCYIPSYIDPSQTIGFSGTLEKDCSYDWTIGTGKDIMLPEGGTWAYIVNYKHQAYDGWLYGINSGGSLLRSNAISVSLSICWRIA